MQHLFNSAKSLILFGWLILGLYFGVSGYLAVDGNASLQAANEVTYSTATIKVDADKLDSDARTTQLKSDPD
jgi:hypothetical protein